MRISDWSSDVCSSDLPRRVAHRERWTVGPGEMRCDEAGGSRRAAHLIDEFGRRAVAAPARILFEWNDHVTDERRGALDKAFGGFGHLALLPASAAPLALIPRRVSYLQIRVKPADELGRAS